MVFVSDGGDDDLEVWGYKENMTRLLITLFLVAVTGVLPLGLFLYWMEHYWLYCTQEPCVLEEATTVLVVVRTFISHNVLFIYLGYLQDHYRGQHTTRYVKKVYREEHTMDDMVIPDIDAGGFRRVSNYRFFNCKKNRRVF